MKDIDYMKLAFQEAQVAASIGEVPVGAVVVFDNNVIATTHNMRVINSDATAHAEILAIKQAGIFLGHWNLSGCKLYVTLEPCLMCAGAIINARIDTVCYGAKDDKWGALNSVYNIGFDNKLNHSFKVISGIMQDECSALLSGFFKNLRLNKK